MTIKSSYCCAFIGISLIGLVGCQSTSSPTKTQSNPPLVPTEIKVAEGVTITPYKQPEIQRKKLNTTPTN